MQKLNTFRTTCCAQFNLVCFFTDYFKKCGIASKKIRGMKAKKSFGQHFLHRADIAERIASSLTLSNSNSNVLEIGPGTGMLTQYLIKRFENLKLIEADNDMVEAVKNRFPKFERENIISKDFLKLDLTQVFNGETFFLIGNFPYNISSQILIRMIDNVGCVTQMVGMFQKEVAERIVAQPGGKVYGVISVLVQAHYSGEYLFGVDRSSFNPPPNVQSAVIRLTRKENNLLNCDRVLFRKVVKQAFSQRRKMLRNTLKPFFQNNPEVLSDNYFTKRPEVLSVAEYADLTNRIEELGNAKIILDENIELE